MPPVCLWLTAAEHGKYIILSGEQLNYTRTYSHHDDDDDYSARQVYADDNQLVKEMEKQKEPEQGRLLLADVKQRPAVQVKVINEVESVTMTRAARRRKLKQYKKRQQQQHRPGLPNGNEHENAWPDTENAVPSIGEGSFLMSPQGHNLANNMSSDDDAAGGIDDGQMAGDEQLLRLQDYNLLYNAERQTYFQLHTSNPSPHSASGMNPNPPPSNGNRLLQQVVGNTLSAAFGLNANANPGMEDIVTTTQTVRLYDAASLRQSRYNPFNPTR